MSDMEMILIIVVSVIPAVWFGWSRREYMEVDTICIRVLELTVVFALTEMILIGLVFWYKSLGAS
jgi:hypothetical protein